MSPPASTHSGSHLLVTLGPPRVDAAARPPLPEAHSWSTSQLRRTG